MHHRETIRRSSYLTKLQPQYRDSTIYKTRYISLLERSLSIVQASFESMLREVTDDVSKQLRAKEHNETAEYVLMYGRYESVVADLDPPLKTILNSREFAFGSGGVDAKRGPHIERYLGLYKQLVESFIRSRDPVGQLLLKNLKKFASSDPTPDTDFNLFARRCVQHVLDICRHESDLTRKFFQDGPVLPDHSDSDLWDTNCNYAEALERNRLSHIKTLHTFLIPYLSNGDLHRVCDLVNWLENKYLTPVEGGEENDSPQEHKSCAQALLGDYLWPLSDTLFIQAATEIEQFKPTPNDLKIPTLAPSSQTVQSKTANNPDLSAPINQNTHEPGSTAASAYPTVKIAVRLLVMYNDNMYDRPVSLQISFFYVKIAQNL